MTEIIVKIPNEAEDLKALVCDGKTYSFRGRDAPPQTFPRYPLTTPGFLYASPQATTCDDHPSSSRDSRSGLADVAGRGQGCDFDSAGVEPGFAGGDPLLAGRQIFENPCNRMILRSLGGWGAMGAWSYQTNQSV